MANIIPIKGLRYNKEKIGNLASVVTPPYDIIDEAAQARYYAENSANIIRLELGLIFPQDTPENNRYSRAEKYLQKWLEDEILIRETKPALYYYQQCFKIDNQPVVRNSFICGLKVEDYSQGNILPHEETLSKPKADRLQLLRATKANFSSIFGLFSDPEKIIDHTLSALAENLVPDINITDEAGEAHRVWVITDAAIIGRIVSLMSDKNIYIADGHHRYETSLEYARIMAEQKIDGYDYVLTTLVNIYDEGLVVLPTHRVVGNVSDFKISTFLKQLEPLFKVEKYTTKNSPSGFVEELAKAGQKNHVIGLYDGKCLYFLTLKNEKSSFSKLPPEKSLAWKNLDVAIADNLILNNLLNIGEEERRNQDNLAYTRDISWLIEQVDSKKRQLGIILNPTKVEDIVKVADAKDKMPQKSTYFYPKLITGLIINYLNH
ncbi:MAG: DUF1015 domain-containing protein [Syntrophomonadaceae bacterium]|jgi:uncharacterized protein (DUF1015 family)|nr:DUF1015 domain-containing protein [Syntrophomonadaceae bacterium]